MERVALAEVLATRTRRRVEVLWQVGAVQHALHLGWDALLAAPRSRSRRAVLGLSALHAATSTSVRRGWAYPRAAFSAQLAIETMTLRGLSRRPGGATRSTVPDAGRLAAGVVWELLTTGDPVPAPVGALIPFGVAALARPPATATARTTAAELLNSFELVVLVQLLRERFLADARQIAEQAEIDAQLEADLAAAAGRRAAEAREFLRIHHDVLTALGELRLRLGLLEGCDDLTLLVTKVEHDVREHLYDLTVGSGSATLDVVLSRLIRERRRRGLVTEWTGQSAPPIALDVATAEALTKAIDAALLDHAAPVRLAASRTNPPAVVVASEAPLPPLPSPLRVEVP